ncbi:MAG: hypothetical protein IT463_05015 [Planctomycetes bacterium]|nr:hypothetical protein [Planctomycetota bacterium]
MNLSPNVGPVASATEFVINGANLLPLASATVTFGTLQFQGVVNLGGSQITSTTAPNGKFTAPAAAGPGAVDVEVFINGQNPPTLQLPNAFYYLSGSPALPTVLTMSPNTSDEFGGTNMSFTGTNVPLAAGIQIVVGFLFSTGAVNLVATQVMDDAWTCTIPAVPAAENFTTGTLQVTVSCTFSGGSLTVPVVASAPNSPTDGNPLTYNHTGTPPAPPPEEYVVASGLFAPNPQNAPDSFVRTVSVFDKAYDSVTQVTGLTSRYMFNGSMALAPGGTHFYPAPLLNSGTSWREASSTFSHFVLPEINRTYIPAVATGQPAPPTVNKPVVGRLYHTTNTESFANPTGTDDNFFAVYSNGEVEVFNVGGTSLHEEIEIHEQFASKPYFAVATASTPLRIFVGRCDGLDFTASGANANEVDCAAVNGTIQQCSLKLAGDYLYFSTSTGNVYRSPVDTATPSTNPAAVACTWPATGSHTIVGDEFALSGNGQVLCFIAGTGTTVFTDPGPVVVPYNPPAPPTTHDVFTILNAHTGNTSITAVTNFTATAGGAKQLVFWNLGDSSSSTYGSQNIDNGANDRRVYMAGVNDFASTTVLSRSDVVMNYDGTLCAFATREDRNLAETPGTTPAFVQYYMYVARVGSAIVNQCVRVLSATTGNFGGGSNFHRDMNVSPGFWFPRKIPNSGMNSRLVFTASGQASLTGAGQHLYTANFSITGGGVNLLAVYDRSEAAQAPPYNVLAAQPYYNYFGGFPSRGGEVLFLVEARSNELLYLDLRDGVSTLATSVTRAHDGAKVKLRSNTTTGSSTENTYLPNGFAEDPAGSVGLEHWGNQIVSLQGPSLSTFTREWMYVVSEEAAGEEEVYVLTMSSLASPLPAAAVNVSNVGGAGVIKAICPTPDGGAVAFVKGTVGFPESYRYSGSVAGSLYVVNDMVTALNDNTTALTYSATQIPVGGVKVSRSMGWYQGTSRYTLYFGEGSSGGSGTGSPPPRSTLTFSKLDLDRTNNNAIGTHEEIKPGGQSLTQGAVYIYGVGKME